VNELQVFHLLVGSSSSSAQYIYDVICMPPPGPAHNFHAFSGAARAQARESRESQRVGSDVKNP